jgi:hypothetical protein
MSREPASDGKSKAASAALSLAGPAELVRSNLRPSLGTIGGLLLGPVCMCSTRIIKLGGQPADMARQDIDALRPWQAW